MSRGRIINGAYGSSGWLARVFGPGMSAKLAALVLMPWVSVPVSRAEILFQGYIISSARPLFVLSVDGQRTSDWLTLGEQFEGFALTAFDPDTLHLTIEKDGERQILRLRGGGAAASRITVTVAKSIFQNLMQISAAADQYMLENGRPPASIHDLVGPNKFIKALIPVAGEDYGQVSLKSDTPIVLIAPGGEIVAVGARGTEGATYAFRRVRRGESLASIEASEAVAASDLMALNPDAELQLLRPGDVIRVR